MTTHHTPGPWTANHFSGTDAYSDVWTPDGKLIDGESTYLSHADSNLIAAAPELLEALYAALPLAEDAAAFMKDDFKPGYLSGLVKIMRDAIAKAEGC